MLARLLISLYLLEVCFNKFSNQPVNSNAPLTIKIPQSARFTQIQIQLLKKQLQLDSILTIQIQTCSEGIDCHKLTIVDSNTHTSQEILLPASTSRIKDSLMRHLIRYQQKIDDQKLKKKKTTQKQSISQSNTNQSSKISKNLQTKPSRWQKDDWERAHLLTNRLQQTTKIKTTSNTASVDVDPKQTNLKAVTPKTKKVTATRQQSDIYTWYLIYILLSAVVIIGMKYMHWEEERMKQQQKQLKHCPHHCNQEEQL